MSEETFRSTEYLVDHSDESPLPLEVIPNHMGINLCSVKGLSWLQREDGQYEKLTINFTSADSP